MNYTKENGKRNVQQSHDDWDEVHQQMQAVQKKSLEISSPGDSDEVEADEIARKVVNGQSASVSGIGNSINRKGEGDAETTPAFQLQLQNTKGGGQQLDNSTRAEMESKMGADFSGVKIHSDTQANQMSEGIHAQAFTHGNDIYFNSGKYNPESPQGKELLAHELVHTQQQLPNKISRRIMVGGTPTTAATLIPVVTPAVNAWYPGIVAAITLQYANNVFNPLTDMPFSQAGAVTRASEILQEMEDAQFLKQGFKYKKGQTIGGTPTATQADYDFTFATNQVVIQEILFRLALLINMRLQSNTNRNTPATTADPTPPNPNSFARYPVAGEGLNMQNSPNLQPVGASTTEFTPGGYSLQPGVNPSTAIMQITTPPPNAAGTVDQRIAVDCSTMMGILYYRTLLGNSVAETQRFDRKFGNNLVVGPVTGQFGPDETHLTPNPIKSYLSEVLISSMDDLVPGDTVAFANYPEYKTVDPGGLWNGEWGVYTRKVGNVQYFEGFGVPEMPYADVIQSMQTAYDSKWTPASNAPKKPKKKSDKTVDGKLPGIKNVIYRINMTAYNR